MITLLKLTPYTGDFLAPSPNYGPRKTQSIEGIVLHATEDAGHEARALAWLRSPRSQASCHLFVGRNGAVTRLVGDRQRAWHAGVSQWRGQRDVNSCTLGIEIANRNDGEPYTDAQYARVAEIVAHYCRQGLSFNDVVAHSEIAPGRKTDPLGWDWGRFRALVQQQLQPVNELPPLIAAMQQATAFVIPKKSVLRSRTLWLNGLTVLAAGVAIIGQTLELTFQIGLTLPERVTTWALFAVGVINIILRFLTTQPVCSQGTQRAAPGAPAACANERPAIRKVAYG